MVKISETAKMRGTFRMRTYRNGVLAETYEDHNLIVDLARGQMAHLIAGDVTGRKVTHIAFGTNGNQPALTDTEITGAFQKAVDSADYPENAQVCFAWTLGTDQANGMEILEFGLLTEDGKLFARRTRANPLNKESDISLEGEWIIEF